MLTFLVASLAFAADPSVALSWKGADGVLTVTGPAGEHVAPDAPAYATLSWGDRALSWESSGVDLDQGIALSRVRGQEIQGDLRLSLCKDGGTLCRLVDVAVSGTVPDAKKGTVALTVAAPAAEAEEEGAVYRADAQASADAAFAEASARGVPVLVDFTAVWCPPCNQFAAEVLHEPAHAELLEGFVLLQIDVDDPSSWTMKDRYAVGGYPTIVVTDGAGAELGRVEGYLGEDEMVGWLGELLEGPAAPPETPAAKARAAWKLAQRGDVEGAKALLAEAAGAEDTVAYRLVRVVEEPSVADVDWLAEHAPDTAPDWVYYATSVSEEEGGADALRRAIRAGLRSADAIESSDLLYVMGTLADEDTAQSWYAASAAAQRAGFSGDPAHDRAYYTWYAHLLQLSGDADAAATFLDEARETFPGEPTWALAKARIYLEVERPAEALATVEQDWDTGWGDNRLRMAKLKVEALQALGRGDEARAFGEEVLAALPAPDDDTDVRSHRYRAKLAEQIGEPTAEADTP